MSTLAHVAEAMQTVLTTEADQAARHTRFVQRQSKLTGALFAQTLVFGWLANAQATLEDLAQTAATRGLCITPQGLEQRFTAAAATYLEALLRAAVTHVIRTAPVAIPLLQRFTGVYLLDSSTIVLPDVLAALWPGCGGRTVAHTQAALKVHLGLDLCTGKLWGPQLHAGRAADSTLACSAQQVAVGALRLADLGYFDLDMFAALSHRAAFWLSRLNLHTALYDTMGGPIDLLAYLRATGTATLDLPVLLGRQHRLAARLLAERVPQEVADQRRRRLRTEARDKGRRVTERTLALADWTVLVTNVPATQLSVVEALVLLRARWQIELLFKLWKSHGHIDESRSAKPWRVLCEVYAKLLAMVIQHWILLVSCWQYPDRSLRKAAHTVQQHALHLASLLEDRIRLEEALTVIHRCLMQGCRINKRRQAPHTYQRLLEPDLSP